MKFQLSLLVIAFIGIASAEIMPPAPSPVFPALLGFNIWNPLPSNTLGGMVNNLECRLSFAETSDKIRNVFHALREDASTSSSRFMNTNYHQQLQQNLNQYFQDLQAFNDLTMKYMTGQMSLYDYVKANFAQYFTLVKNLIVGKVYLIRAGISFKNLLPKTHDALKNLMKTLGNDIGCMITHPTKIMSYLHEVWTLLFGRNMLSMNMGMGPLTPLSGMMNMY